MKLKGTKTEQDIRQELIRSNEALFINGNNNRLLDALRLIQGMKTAYILDWFPDESEDFFRILVNDGFIVEIEINRFDFNIPPKIEFLSIPKYRLGLRRQDQIKLEVAMDLAKQNLQNTQR